MVPCESCLCMSFLGMIQTSFASSLQKLLNLECFKLCIRVSWYFKAPNFIGALYLTIDMDALIFVILFQIITTFSVVDNMKEQFYSERAKTFRYECLVVYSVVYSSSSSFVFFFVFPWYTIFEDAFHKTPEDDLLGLSILGKMTQGLRSCLMILKN